MFGVFSFFTSSPLVVAVCFFSVPHPIGPALFLPGVETRRSTGRKHVDNVPTHTHRTFSTRPASCRNFRQRLLQFRLHSHVNYVSARLTERGRNMMQRKVVRTCEHPGEFCTPAFVHGMYARTKTNGIRSAGCGPITLSAQPRFVALIHVGRRRLGFVGLRDAMPSSDARA